MTEFLFGAAHVLATVFGIAAGLAAGVSLVAMAIWGGDA